MKYLVMFFFCLTLIACYKANHQKATEEMSPLEKQGQQWINAAIEAHGGDRYTKAHYQFVFRDKTYTFKNDGKNYRYQLNMDKKGIEYEDVLDNSGFTRHADGKQLELSEKETRGYSNSLNSVIYFATLPHKLNDSAVRKKYIGEQNIAKKKYEVIQVTFTEENGGVDHDDMYYYWINAETKIIDYFAYNYQVNKGGVRFRTAGNPRKIDGIVFQDYVNYKAEVGTPLGELPILWEEGKLEKLSEINTEQIVRL